MLINHNEQIRSRVRGCLLGVAIGDALGMPWETMPPEEILTATNGRGVTTFHPPHQTRVKDTVGLAAGSTTDDWQLTTVVARSLLATSGRLDIADCARRHVESLAQTTFGWGKGTQKATEDIRDARRDISRRLPMPESGKASGNGVVMKIAPLAIVSGLRGEEPAKDSDPLLDACVSLGDLTHPDRDASVAAYAVAAEIRALVFNRFLSPPSLGNLVRRAEGRLRTDRATSGRLEDVAQKGADAFYGEARAQKGKAYSGPVSAALALAIFWQYEGVCGVSWQDLFLTAMARIIGLGGDTDTNASILGGLLGAWFGEEGIPLAWRKFRPEFHEAIDLADELCSLAT